MVIICVLLPSFYYCREALEALPETVSEKEFVDYVNGLNNYYGSFFLNKPGSPIIRQVASNPNNVTAIIEVVIFHSLLNFS